MHGFVDPPVVGREPEARPIPAGATISASMPVSSNTSRTAACRSLALLHMALGQGPDHPSAAVLVRDEGDPWAGARTGRRRGPRPTLPQRSAGAVGLVDVCSCCSVANFASAAPFPSGGHSSCEDIPVDARPFLARRCGSPPARGDGSGATQVAAASYPGFPCPLLLLRQLPGGRPSAAAWILGACSAPRARRSIWSAAACATPCWAGPSATWTSRPRAARDGLAADAAVGGVGVGRRHPSSGRSGPSIAGRPRRDHHLPRRLLRTGLTQAGRCLRAVAGRGRCATRLHRQHPGGLAAGVRPDRPLRRGAPTWSRGPAHPYRAGGVLLRRSAADDAGGPVRLRAGFRRGSRGARGDPEMAERICIVSAERVQVELSRLLLGAHPRAGLAVLVDTGLADHVLPELPALRLEIDEHHRHKDVYEHSLTVLEQAIDLEADGPDLVLRLPPCCTTSASRGPAGSSRAAASASTTTNWWGADDPAAAEGAALRQRPDRRRLPAGGAAPAVPRVRRRSMDGRRGAPLCPRRRPAAAAAARAHPRRLHNPQPAPGPRAAARVRRAGAPDRGARGAGGVGRHPSRPGRQRHHAHPRARARAGGRRGVPVPAGPADGPGAAGARRWRRRRCGPGGRRGR